MKIELKNIRYWPILHYFPVTLMKNVRLVYVFGEPCQVLLATNDDRLFVYRYPVQNSDRSKPNSSTYGISGLTEIQQLSGKRIKGLATNQRCPTIHNCCPKTAKKLFVVSYLESGEVHLWGDNPLIQTHEFLSPTLIETLPRTVIQVAVGAGHILALTSNGEVYCWENNKYGQIGPRTGPELVSEPVKVNQLTGFQITEIACGSSFSVALTSNGIVYYGGQCIANVTSPLYHSSYTNYGHGYRHFPQKLVALQDTCIKKIVCGSHHNIMALNVQNNLFTWGCNSRGQLGISPIGENTTRDTPIRLVHFPRFREIASLDKTLLELLVMAKYMFGVKYLVRRVQYHY